MHYCTGLAHPTKLSLKVYFEIQNRMNNSEQGWADKHKHNNFNDQLGSFFGSWFLIFVNIHSGSKASTSKEQGRVMFYFTLFLYQLFTYTNFSFIGPRPKYRLDCGEPRDRSGPEEGPILDWIRSCSALLMVSKKIGRKINR